MRELTDNIPEGLPIKKGKKVIQWLSDETQRTLLYRLYDSSNHRCQYLWVSLCCLVRDTEVSLNLLFQFLLCINHQEILFYTQSIEKDKYSGDDCEQSIKEATNEIRVSFKVQMSKLVQDIQFTVFCIHLRLGNHTEPTYFDFPSTFYQLVLFYIRGWFIAAMKDIPKTIVRLFVD